MQTNALWRGIKAAMKRVAVFGNAGAGKSALARRLAEITRLPLCVLDKVQFREGGEPVPCEEYLERHRNLLAQQTWIIDGYGDSATAWERFAAADTLIHVDPKLPVLYWRVTKRLVKGVFADPEGWPKDSPPMEQHDDELQGHTALPSIPDAKIPAARRRNGRVEARRSPEITAGSRSIPG